MDYRRVYMKIIKKAKIETLEGLRPSKKYFKKDFEKYFEFHHILPKSIYPKWANRKSNMVALTAREHFFCHQLLEKIYPNSGMFLALWWLANDGQNKACSSREYQKLKERYALNPVHKENSIKATKESWKDPIKRAARIEKIKEARAKQVNMAWGKRSDESKKNISNGTKKAMQDPELRKHLSEKSKEVMSRPEMKKMLSENGKKGGEIAKEKAKLYKEYKANGGTLSWNEFQKNC